MRIADVAIVSREPGLASGLSLGDDAEATPDTCTLYMPEKRRETYLVIRSRESAEVVTVIELLSPANKRRGGDGRREYLSKREQILESPTHLVELDLLRGGLRLPIVEPLPRADYFCIVSKAWSRPRAELYSWSMQQRLPTIPIPLKRGDGNASVKLQEVFNTVYDRAGYDLSVNYQADLDPVPDEETKTWLRTVQR